MTFITFAQIIFWSSASVLIYVYVGYPLLVYAVSRLFPKQINQAALGTFHSTFFLAVFALPRVLCATALTARLLEKKRIKADIFTMLLYFVLANLTSFIRFCKFLLGEYYARQNGILET